MTHAQRSTTPVHTPDEDGLLERVAARDAAAFRAFYDATVDRVFGVALRVLRDRRLAEEVAQEVYVEAWRSAARDDRTRGTASTWLLTLTQRRAVDRLRSVQPSRDRDGSGATRDVERGPDVTSGDVVTGSDRDEVRDALRRLSRIQREALHLTYDEGLTYREAAERLGRPLGTVTTRIRDGLRRLGDQLGQGSAV